MPPLLKFLTLPAILLTLFPRATPGKASEFPEKWIISAFYGVIGWSLLGAPNWNKVSVPEISLPKPSPSTLAKPPGTGIAQPVPVTTFTTATTSTAVKPAAQSNAQSGVRVICPAPIKVVNIRQSAGLTAVIASVPCGDRVTVTSTDRISSSTEIWVPIDYKGTKGWATARYLDLTLPALKRRGFLVHRPDLD